MDIRSAMLGLVSVAAVIVWGVALGAFPVLSQVLAIRASHEVPAAAAPMINTTFNIGITVGSIAGTRAIVRFHSSEELARPLIVTCMRCEAEDVGSICAALR